MDLATANTRFTVIEREWSSSSGGTRADLRDELSLMKESLAESDDSDAASARWLTRRIDRVVRFLDATPTPVVDEGPTTSG